MVKKNFYSQHLAKLWARASLHLFRSTVARTPAFMYHPWCMYIASLDRWRSLLWSIRLDFITYSVKIKQWLAEFLLLAMRCLLSVISITFPHYGCKILKSVSQYPYVCLSAYISWTNPQSNLRRVHRKGPIGYNRTPQIHPKTAPSPSTITSPI